MADEAVEHPPQQIALSEALKNTPTYSSKSLSRSRWRPIEFGRIGAQTAKQVILQKIRDAEREQIFKDFLGARRRSW